MLPTSAPPLVIAGETYSANLGDGIIAETMRFLFHRAHPDAPIRLLDLSGRAGPSRDSGSPGGRKVEKGLRWLLPPRLWHWLHWQGVQRRRCLPRWRTALTGATALVIGGGQLLMDNYLDFPLKLHALARLAKELDVPVHISACGAGVGRPWSPLGTRLLRETLSLAQTVTVRDARSQRILRERLGVVPSAVTFDPAVWAADLYGAAPPEPVAPVGLGVLDVHRLNANNPDRAPLAEAALIEFWVEVIAGLHHIGRSFELFSNGGTADEAFARTVAEAVTARLGVPCPRAPRPRQPRDLARTVSRYTAVVASRLHANLLALAYAIPSVGLVWDAKVRSFYEETDRPDRWLSLYACDAPALLAKLDAALEAGIDRAALRRYKDAAQQTVSIVWEAHQRASQPTTPPARVAPTQTNIH